MHLTTVISTRVTATVGIGDIRDEVHPVGIRGPLQRGRGSGQPIADCLTSPGTWVFLGIRSFPGYQTRINAVLRAFKEATL
jgi:hypothetical protein